MPLLLKRALILQVFKENNIAEISYITGKPASADVISKEGLTFYVWNRSVLNNLRKSKPDTMEKLDRIRTLDMAGNLIR